MVLFERNDGVTIFEETDPLFREGDVNTNFIQNFSLMSQSLII